MAGSVASQLEGRSLLRVDSAGSPGTCMDFLWLLPQSEDTAGEQVTAEVRGSTGVGLSVMN